jgi:processive 1,2-diacylglycerol beta-glucosyltransferase
MEGAMIDLYDKDSGKHLGTIADDDLQFLIDQLEEESSEDKDYWFNRDTLKVFEKKGCPPALLELLEKAMGDRNELEIRWEPK